MVYTGSFRQNPKASFRYKKTYPKKKRYNKTKQMVVGHGPTLLERIANGAGTVAKLATAVAPVIAAINTEEKYYDQTQTLTAYNPGTNDIIRDLSQAIQQGVTDSTRVGNSVLAKNLSLRVALSFAATTGAPNVMGVHCRFMLICWKANFQTDGPTIAKIFEAPNNLYSPVNKDNSDSFVVMKDKFFTLESPNGLAGSAGFRSLKIFKNLNWHMRWIDGAGTALGTQNHIVMIIRCSAAGVTNALSATYYSRLNYTDN